MRYKDGYMEGEEFATEKILLASNDAGQSINIARTTAAHAMSYKITTRYGTPHGFAVALCLPKIWRYMQTHTQLCLDKRGEAHVKQVFEDIAKSLGAQSVEEAIEIFENLLNEWGMYAPKLTSRKEELKILASSVNAQRLSNNPIELSEEALYQIYEQVFKEE
jgi:alcohol dehydrogenase class IV